MQKHFGSSYKICAWNVNGWYSKEHPENTKFKYDTVTLLDHDIYFLSETFCKNDDTISVNNYTCFNFNRQNISKRSIRGSGGLAILLSNKLLVSHTVLSVIKGNQDGILGLKLKSHENDSLIGLITNYLPPDSFHYGKDPESYFLDNSVMYDELIDCDLLICGGDLNSRTKTMLDYIPDVDGQNFALRSNPDTDRNSHGDQFIQFLKDKRALICNGRITPEFNNFTFINPRGRSVPDYIYCPADHIQYCKSVRVLKVSDLINDLKLSVPRSIPDHSVLSSEFDLCTYVNLDSNFSSHINYISSNICKTHAKPKKNIRKIDEHFMSSQDIIEQVNSTIIKLENISVNQNEIDNIYTEIINMFTLEINKLPDISSAQSRKGRQSLRKASQFWNDELQRLWEICCYRENIYCSYHCNGSRSDQLIKQRLRNDFKTAQSSFDKKHRQLKRQHKTKAFQSLAQLADDASSNPTEIWKRLKALSEPKSSRAILEIIRNDGTISTDIQEILTQWHKDFSDCFAGLKDNIDLAFDDEFLDNITRLKNDFDQLSPEQQQSITPCDSSKLNDQITLEEVEFAVKNSKLGKAFLLVPNEALKNPQSIRLLHKLFNTCFQSGLTPLDWSKADIKPVPKPDKDSRVPLQNRPISIICCIAKVYSYVLDCRVKSHLNANNLLCDTQNGFRAGRSCIDHIFSLVTLLRNLKTQNKQVFLCFIDFRRAFDSVNRPLLLYKISSQFGIIGNMYNALTSLYQSPMSRIILNENATDWFNCPLGVKQGDCISPTLFSMYINDLAT